MKPHVVSASTRIAVPRATVWSTLCDVARYDEWVESTLSVTSLDGPARLGCRYVTRTRVSGFWKATISWRIVAFDPPSRQVHEGDGVPGVDALSVTMDLEADGDATEFTLTYAYSPRGLLVAPIAELALSSNVTAEQKRSVRTFAIVSERDAEEAGGGRV